MARRTERLNPVHVLRSRRDVPVRERGRRAQGVRHVLQQRVLFQSGASPEYPVARYPAVARDLPYEQDVPVRVLRRRRVGRSWLRRLLEVWPESHWPGFALREADVFKTYMAWWCM